VETAASKPGNPKRLNTSLIFSTPRIAGEARRTVSANLPYWSETTGLRGHAGRCIALHTGAPSPH